jgi:hypothetical protein
MPPEPEDHKLLEWRLNAILQEIGGLRADVQEMEKKLTVMTTEIEVLKVTLQFKSGLWGAAAGALPVLLLIAIWFFQSANKSP